MFKGCPIKRLLKYKSDPLCFLQSEVRLKECADGTWWRTSSTDHYAEFDTEISKEEAVQILNSYKPVELQTKPISEFKEP